MSYRDIASICVLLVMLITIVGAWIIHWIAGVAMLYIWLSVFAASALYDLAKNK